MASIHLRGRNFFVKFYFARKQYLRSLKTSNKKEALHAKNRVEQNIHLISTGVLSIPPDENIGDFILRGKPLSQKERKASSSISIKDLVEAYLRHAEPHMAESSLKTEKIHLRHLLSFLGNKATMPVVSVNTAIIDKYVTERKKVVSPNTINKELQSFSQLFKYGVERGYCNTNPVNGGHRFKKAGLPHRFMTKKEIDEQISRGGLSEKDKNELMRFRYLTTDEIAELLDLAESSILHPFLTVLAYTGMRRGEALSLEWSDVDLKRKKIFVKSRKQSTTAEFTGRDIDIHPKLLTILKRHKRASKKGKFVFCDEKLGPWHRDKVHREFKNLTAGTSFEGIGFHCLRHSFASNLAALGVDQRIIDHFMGHQTEEMRRRYQHLFPASRRKAIDSLTY